MLNRSWIAFVTVLALVLAIMCILSVLQYRAIQTKLLQDRLAVIATTVAGPLQSVINFGLPISTLRNADEILARAKAIDPIAGEIRVFHQTGIVVHASEGAESGNVSRDVMFQQATAGADRWVASSDGQLSAGLTLRNATGNPVGGILVSTDEAGAKAVAKQITSDFTLASIAVWIVFSGVGFLVLRQRLGGLHRSLEHLKTLANRQELEKPQELANFPSAVIPNGILADEIEGLEQQLAQAAQSFDAVEFQFSELISEEHLADVNQDNVTRLPGDVLARNSGGRLALAVARHLTPWAAVTVFAAVLVLGVFVHRTVTASFTPELAARTELIGAVANQNIQHAIDAGVPLENLVGAEDYFDDLLINFPEISYFGIATGRIVFEAGNRQEKLFAPRQSRKDVPAFPIYADNNQVGYILVEASPDYFVNEFREILMDFGVVLLVVLLLTFQVVTLLISRAITAPFVQLQYLAGLQAAGDFSKILVVSGKSAVDTLSQNLSDRAQLLYLKMQQLNASNLTEAGSKRLSNLRACHNLLGEQPTRLRFAYLNDLRLPLFLFTAADELPLAFFPLYTRAAQNPLTWLDPGVVIALPLAGYLIAIVLGSPFARPLAGRLGYRKLLLMALVPTALAHIGLYFSTTTLEIILYRTFAGFGYAIVTLACQDYVLDAVAPEERPRTLATFTGAAYSGILAGTALGGVLADRLGQSEVFVISAALVLLSAVFIVRLLPGVQVATLAGREEKSALFPPIWKPLSNIRFFALVMGIAVPANIVLQAFVSFLVALQLHDLGASAAETGRILMIYFISIVFAGPFPALLIRRGIPAVWVLLAGAFVAALCMMWVAFAPGVWSMLLAVLGAGIGNGLIRDTQFTIAMEIAEENPQNNGSDMILGALRTIERLSSVIGLILFALLASIAGYTVATAGMIMLLLFGALLFAAVNLRYTRQFTVSATCRIDTGGNRFNCLATSIFTT